MTGILIKSDRLDTLTAACAGVNNWLAGIPHDAWTNLVEGTWTVKDLVGHLAAWSDLILDQIDALAQNAPDRIQRIDIDRWNASQIHMRRDWSAARIRREWDQTAERARRTVERLPAEMWAREALVPWKDGPISLDDLLDLWILHITQHQTAWKG